MNEDIESDTWQSIIGEKIVCSKCSNKTNFNFQPNGTRPKQLVRVTCLECNHSGDYNPTEVEVYQYEYKARAAIDKKILETPHLKGKISNVKVTSVYREGDAQYE